MKRRLWTVMLLSLSSAFLLASKNVSAEEFTASESFYVTDTANILSDQVETSIISKNKGWESTESKPQVAIVTVESLDGVPIEEKAIEVFETLQLGSDDLDNGVLLLISKEDGAERIEVGYGLEGAITDMVSGNLLNEQKVNFDSGDFDTAVTGVFNGLTNEIEAEYNGSVSSVDTTEVGTETNPFSDAITIVIMVVFVIFMGIIYFVSPKLFWIIMDILQIVLRVILIFGNSSSSSSSKRSSGGGGRSGGGGASS